MSRGRPYVFFVAGVDEADARRRSSLWWRTFKGDAVWDAREIDGDVWIQSLTGFHQVTNRRQAA